MSLEQALKKFVTSNRDGITHTKIGNPELNVFGNKYSISPENEISFYKAYMKYVLEENQEAYLTEKQLECGKIAIDLDFRYKASVKHKQHTEEHIDELMKVMGLINPSIERPYFLKPINDKKLKIEYTPVSAEFAVNNFGLEFVSIDLYRQIGVTKHQIYHICIIPINIGAQEDEEHVIGTQSADLTSATMLFRIFKLFRDGRLLHKYVPPYCITYRDELGRLLKQYIGMMIHFNNYRTVDHWLDLTRDEIRDKFIRYAQEINNFIY